jgi:hypothetical protein
MFTNPDNADQLTTNTDKEKKATYEILKPLTPAVEAEARKLLDKWAEVDPQSKYPYMTNDEYRDMLEKKNNK